MKDVQKNDDDENDDNDEFESKTQFSEPFQSELWKTITEFEIPSKLVKILMEQPGIISQNNTALPLTSIFIQSKVMQYTKNMILPRPKTEKEYQTLVLHSLKQSISNLELSEKIIQELKKFCAKDFTHSHFDSNEQSIGKKRDRNGILISETISTTIRIPTTITIPTTIIRIPTTTPTITTPNTDTNTDNINSNAQKRQKTEQTQYTEDLIDLTTPRSPQY